MTPSSPQPPGPAPLAEPAGGTKKDSGTGLASRSASQKLLRWLGRLLLLSVAVGCLLLELSLQFGNKKNTLDFLAFYTAGTILRQGAGKQLYDLTLQSSIGHRLLPDSLTMLFYHPPFEAWLFEPLAGFSLPHAFLLWSVVNLAVLGRIFYLFRFTGYQLDQDRRLIWLLASLPIVAGVIVKGQDSLLLALVFLLAFLALKRRRDVVAGLVLGVGLFRFEIVLPFLFIFLLRRRWKVLAGFTGMAAAVGAASLALVGVNGLLQYIGILIHVGRAGGSVLAGSVASMPSLRGAMATLFGAAIPPGLLFPFVLAGTLLLLGWAAWEFKSVSRPGTRAFDLQFSCAVIAALIASYHLFFYMLTPLLIVAFLAMGHESLERNEGLLKDRAGTILVLAIGLLPIAGYMVHFYSYTVLFIVIMGLGVWCIQESLALASRAVPPDPAR